MQHGDWGSWRMSKHNSKWQERVRSRAMLQTEWKHMRLRVRQRTRVWKTVPSLFGDRINALRPPTRGPYLYANRAIVNLYRWTICHQWLQWNDAIEDELGQDSSATFLERLVTICSRFGVDCARVGNIPPLLKRIKGVRFPM